MGSVLAAVSPAVVIPRMVMLTNRAYGTEKSIPQMIMAGAGLDNVFVIMLFLHISWFYSGRTYGTRDLHSSADFADSWNGGRCRGRIVAQLVLKPLTL